MTVNSLPVASHYQVICFTINDRDIGLLCTAPIDAAEVTASLDTRTLQQPGVMGSAVLMDQTTQMLDIQQVVQLGRPDFINEENHHG